MSKPKKQDMTDWNTAKDEAKYSTSIKNMLMDSKTKETKK